MFFSAGKIFWIIAQPLNLALILLLLATLLLWSRWRRLGVWLTSLVALTLLSVAVLPIGHWLLTPLARQFAPYDIAAHANESAPAGIILLSGAAINLAVSHQVGHTVPGHAAGRMVEYLRLAKVYPKARLLICGGNRGPGAPEATMIADYLISQGIARDRLLVEDRSVDTFENAVFGRALAKPQTDERWLLVTSAWHMPRAMGVFRTQGWPVVAAPAMRQHTIGTLGFKLSSRMRLTNKALHEYMGLLAYWLKGRSETLWPTPVG
ncbi:MAG: YdcF family protein [Rhodospirillaceae bacterium]|jgi:uncharacterized SAM-binding protein YcdF (DUF218 family)|nr:YdcF family protein [Rhodospirillaceae bacterium]MBT5083135.1 YdcF family protein [Rhodospirillaceae bacterium]MBT5523335.1 YdcF family protein [Rhodospirillaceae bacterium]MBT5877520.1 YdcF family protein [Rhodospirillaceae bacterium]MBT6592031.1 YdcF family protein [Rhodospirillaceae bacterium]